MLGGRCFALCWSTSAAKSNDDLTTVGCKTASHRDEIAALKSWLLRSLLSSSSSCLQYGSTSMELGPAKALNSKLALLASQDISI